jgi:outer membrane lipoprotein-sorting protein
MDLADPQQTSAKALDIIQYGLPKDYYSTYPTRVSKFTAAELRTTAQRVFPPNDLHVIVTGTAAQIMPKLERFGKFKTYDLDLKPIAKVETALKPASLTLDQVLEKMYAAINKPAMEQLKSVEKTSNVTITEQTMKMTGKETEIISVPNLRYEKIELQSLPVIERKNDGSQIYEYQANQLTRGLQGSELTDELSFNMFKKELMLKNPDMNTKLLGISEMKDGDCYVLEVAKEGTSKEKWYISDKTGLVVRREQESPDNPVTYEYSDFRKVGDIPFAYKLTISGAMSMSMDYTDIKLNTNPDPKLFKTK